MLERFILFQFSNAHATFAFRLSSRNFLFWAYKEGPLFCFSTQNLWIHEIIGELVKDVLGKCWNCCCSLELDWSLDAFRRTRLMVHWQLLLEALPFFIRYDRRLLETYLYQWRPFFFQGNCNGFPTFYYKHIFYKGCLLYG